jgi:hypothetical protein
VRGFLAKCADARHFGGRRLLLFPLGNTPANHYMSLYLDCTPQPPNVSADDMTTFVLTLRGRDGTPVARKGAAEARGRASMAGTMC